VVAAAGQDGPLTEVAARTAGPEGKDDKGAAGARPSEPAPAKDGERQATFFTRPFSLKKSRRSSTAMATALAVGAVPVDDAIAG
jgi:hypothetical protein